MKCRDLDQGDIQRSIFRKHDLERNPDAMIDSSFYALGFDSCLAQVLP
jgi:hypothetical protein